MNRYDFSDHDKLETLRAEHSERGFDLAVKLNKAIEKGNSQGIERARKAIAKHKIKGEQMKEWAKETHFYWYP